MSGWKLTARAPREAVEAALGTHSLTEGWDPDFVVGASEVPDRPEEWLLEGWLARRPDQHDMERLLKLFAGARPELHVEKLADIDWVTVSQERARPVRIGPFRIRTPDFPPAPEPGVIEFEIPAAQAFGTGQHATTAGCLEMLAAMQARGLRFRSIADIGTGTGLLAFAALKLWPQARATATDNDPLCAPAIIDNAARNNVQLGDGRGELAFGIEAGVEGELHEANVPYELLIANILARPLIDLAPQFAEATAPRGHLLLAGLLTSQEQAVRTAFLRVGFGLTARLVKGEWSILWLRRRFRA
jgi:ribosomal protein L11 methyltransferase